jgi:hypothetical protein
MNIEFPMLNVEVKNKFGFRLYLYLLTAYSLGLAAVFIS